MAQIIQITLTDELANRLIARYGPLETVQALILSRLRAEVIGEEVERWTRTRQEADAEAFAQAAADHRKQLEDLIDKTAAPAPP